jgi:general secretion pathway protein D
VLLARSARGSGASALLALSLLLFGVREAQAQRRAAPDTRTPPGDAGELPSTMDKIAQATDVEYRPKPGAHLVRFNLQDADLAELVNHISGMTGRRFIYGSKVRNIKATVVAPEPVTLDEAYQAFLSILEANGMTVVPHGRFLKIVDSAGVAGQGTPVYDRGAPVPDTAGYITRIYRTRYVSVDEAANLLGKFKSKEGDVATYAPGNLLIITDTGSQVRRMVRILEEVDVGGAGQQMWIEPVNHGSASDLATRVNDLFEVGEGGAGGLTKVVADEQTNSLIVVGTDDSYKKLLQVVKRLDTRPGEAGRVHVLPLQHAVADELAKTLQQMLSGQTGGGAKPKGGAGGGSAGGMFEGEVTVTPDQATNALVVSSSPRDFAQLRLVVDRLDQPRRQVFIEAVIMDVGVSDENSLGFSWHGGAQQNIDGQGDATLLGGFQAVNSTIFPADPAALQGFAAGVRGPDLPGTSNLTGTGLSIPAFGVVVNALAGSGRGNVLATPHIIATDNVVAEINVGENIPLQTNVGGGIGQLASLGAGGQVAAGNLAAMSGFGFNAPREDVGNKIKVTPHINESDQVRLEIEQESSAPGTPVGNLGAIPITKRTASTTVVVKDQQTIVIGGLMRDEHITSRDKVPILGDIPVLGFLFSSTREQKRKTNLLLILTPHVIREQEDLRRIFERKMQERQEFIDRYFVFETNGWRPPRDYTRANGLVEDIRQAYFAIDDELRLQAELAPRALHEHDPGEPIELPSGLKAGSGASDGGARPAPPDRAPRPAPPNRAAGGQGGPGPSAPPQGPTGAASGAPGEFRVASAGPALRLPPPVRSVDETEQ